MNSKKILSTIGAVAVAASMALSGLSVCAAVTTMPDGGQFDAAYYAATYPDVVAALGTDANTLYQHYKLFGAAEGRQPYAAGTARTATTAATTGTTLTATEKANAQKILNEYISGKRTWYGFVNDYSYTGKGRYSKAVNPQFAIADINRDGAAELYTNGGEGWEVYILQKAPGNFPDAYPSTYSSAFNVYLGEIGIYATLFTLDSQKVTLYSWSPDEVNAMNATGKYTYQYMPEDTYDTIILTDNAFQTIDAFIQPQALTKANVKAIK